MSTHAQPSPREATAAGHPVKNDAMDAAKPPVGTGPAPLVAQLIALALIALGVLGIQEALVRSGLVASKSWTSAGLDAVDGTRAATWVVVVGALLILAGVLLLPIVIMRRPRKTVSLTANTGVYIHTRDLGRICGHAVEGADAVTSVHVRTAARKVHVTATTVAPKDRNAEITADVRSRLTTTLDALERTPRVKVSIKNEGL